LSAGPATQPRKNNTAKKSQQKVNPGLMKGCRRRHVTRNKIDKIYVGTWNVMTLLKPGKLQELAEEIAKIQIEIRALQEVRWPGIGRIVH
jgi:transcriptional regulator NrdR family protein